MAKFNQETLRKLHDCKEVAIRTTKHPTSAVTIWIVVSGTDVFVRSVRGAKGRWYRDLADGGRATLEFNGEQLAVQAVAATDAGSIERASQEFLSKYRPSPLCRIDCAPRGIKHHPEAGPTVSWDLTECQGGALPPWLGRLSCPRSAPWRVANWLRPARRGRP